ncbi:MAG: efflux RND transporter permease subunit [Campylobacterales bacterium]|nr:efflux RND transporter permease subunit [Campylobacterales bacterium]
MKTFIQFFIEKERLNYTLLIFLTILGVVSYIFTPKEIFPPIQLDKVAISGTYIGASAETLDKMAVTNIEDEIKNISGIKKVESLIQANMFKMVLTIDEGFDKIDVLNKVKDAISLAKTDLPSDMDEPSATLIEGKIPLVQISISSSKISHDELVDIAKETKTKLSSIKNLTDIIIYGESDKIFEIILDSKKLDSYNLDKSSVISAISNMSYIFPIGKIEDLHEHFFISTFNGEKDIQPLLNSVIKVNSKSLYLKDIATVQKKYQDSATMARFNGNLSIQLNVSKSEFGNAIELSKIIENQMKELTQKHQNISFDIFLDTSVYIKERLNIVISNIMFGLLLVSFTMYILINKRISFIVALGIPTSFVMGTTFLYFSGYSINMITLLGALIVLGVIVDDAIVVAENIQRYLTLGYSKKDAAILGTKEVAIPVIAASVTTVFAFIPMLLLSGEMGALIKMIPVAITVLIIASLIESFIFLPLHSMHVLKVEDKELDWSKFQNLYLKSLKFFIHYKRVSLAFFIISITVLTIFSMKYLKYQLFPKFDGTQVYVSGKFSPNTSIEQTHEKIKSIEKILLENSKSLHIKSVSTVSGFRMDNKGEGDNGSNLFMFFLELYKAKPENFIDEFITPVLSFDFDDEDKIRDIKSFDIADKLRELLKNEKIKLNLEEFDVTEQKAGVVKNDIEIDLSSDDTTKLINSIKIVKDELSGLNGITNLGDDAKDGLREIKLKINRYGQELGFNEAILATTLSSYFLEAERAKSFDKDGIVKIIIRDEFKDNLETLKNFELNVPQTNKKIRLSDICEFVYIQNFEKVVKENGNRKFSVMANVNSDIVTPNEVLDLLKPTFEKLELSGIKITLKGEKEQNSQMIKEFSMAFLIAIFLIFLSLLLMFDSFKYTFLIISVIPLSLLGAIIGHYLVGINFTMPSIIGIIGLAGVVINDGIIMLDFIKNVTTHEEMFQRAKLRLRPIILTSVTTFVGLITLMFFPSGQAALLQPLAISLGFGLAWGTFLNLIYLPTLFAVVNSKKLKKDN